MKITKIKNKYMFNSIKPNSTHYYLVYKDKRTNEVRAIELTHLYKRDNYRFTQLKRGLYKKMKFSHRELLVVSTMGILLKI